MMFAAIGDRLQGDASRSSARTARQPPTGAHDWPPVVVEEENESLADRGSDDAFLTQRRALLGAHAEPRAKHVVDVLAEQRRRLDFRRGPVEAHRPGRRPEASLSRKQKTAAFRALLATTQTSQWTPSMLLLRCAINLLGLTTSQPPNHKTFSIYLASKSLYIAIF